MFSMTVTRRKDRLTGLDRRIRQELEQVADKGAHDILDAARANIQAMGAYDTGAMYRSGHVEGQAALTKRVVFDVEYALYVHEGHVTASGSYVPGRPFLAKAANEAPRTLDRAMADAVERAAR